MAEHHSLGMTREEGIKKVYDRPSHVVILGAGASIAAAKDNPERNGKKLPSMENFIDVLGLGDLFGFGDSNGLCENFEKAYSCMHSESPDSPEIAEIEKRVADYFSGMSLPPTPTIYDYLVLALRPKDLVATFNWDPFLYQAYVRNGKAAQMPRMSFLHGNVSIGYSPEDQRTGPAGWFSKETGHEYVPTKLLYPVTQKNYNDDEFIAREWERLERGLKQAGRVTIFGYSAPETDVEAMDLLSAAWGDSGRRSMEQIEFIDILPEDVLSQRWERLLFVGHHEWHTCYFQSSLAFFPRRTGESYRHQYYANNEHEAFQKCNPVPSNFKTLEEMWAWHEPLIKAEKEHFIGEQEHLR